MRHSYLLSAAASIAALAASSPVWAAPILNPGNGHYYEYIGNALSFDDALAAAGAASYLGNGGYLATVTSQSEQDFIFNSVTTQATWFSGTDRGAEGVWKWVAGPEAGTIFWNGGVGGSSPTYANWSGGEPNNCCGGENFLWGNWSGSQWNDIFPVNLGYTIEYGGLGGGVPEPASWALMIAGFGLVGAAARRRARVTKVTFV
jgi:hypothetical protein